MQQLIEIMQRLRDPEKGCPWDAGQDFSTIAPYTIEEAYEVADAIAREDFNGLKDELGDLLLQVVLHAQYAAEEGIFDMSDVQRAVTTKIISRHPHVFADVVADTPEEVSAVLGELAKLRDAGTISEAEYEAKKTELLGRL